MSWRKVYVCGAAFVLSSVGLWSSSNAQQSGPSPDEMFRQLDANQDGRLTLGEGGPGAQQMIRRLFEMSGKKEGDSISRDELLRIAEQHRRGNNANNGGKPADRSSGSNRDPRRGPNAEPARDAGDSTVRSASSSPAVSDPARQRRLTGTWRGWIVDGRGDNPDAGQMQIELQVEGNRIVGREVGTNRAPEGLGEGTFVIAGTTDVADSGTLDAVSTSGQHRGRQYPGVYQLDGNTLRWCVNNRNGSRPTTFETGRGNYFMILRKQP